MSNVEKLRDLREKISNLVAQMSSIPDTGHSEIDLLLVRVSNSLESALYATEELLVRSSSEGSESSSESPESLNKDNPWNN